MAKKKYKFAVIGTGMIANAAHLPALGNLARQGRAEVIGAADIREDALKETAARYNIPKIYTDPAKMLSELEPDVVSVCTPNAYHKKWSIEALRAGFDVICEKPLTVSLDDAKEMFAEADKNGKTLYPAQSMRWRNNMEYAKEVIAGGWIGTPYFCDISFIRRYGIPSWGMFHMKEHNCGGPFCDLGVHYLDALLWMTGNPKIISVSRNTYKKRAGKGEDVLFSVVESGAHGGLFTPRPYDYREFTVEEFAVGSMRLEGGFSVNFKLSWAVNLPYSGFSMSIVGEKGGLVIDKNMLISNVGRYQSDMELKPYDNRPGNEISFSQHWYMY
ncbi:MAG: Gfo/Idh/MocA family oxidoreductase, partial [Eubacteriales bacterium]|nr:Gfo/Idh/MocA family oxidoreductase [Eubacteriales bacterium]